MSLNCLTCHVLQRTNSFGSDREYDNKQQDKESRTLCCVYIERSWSGNLTPPPSYEQIDKSAPSEFWTNELKKKVKVKVKVKKGPGHRRLYSTGGVAYEGSTEPRLVRSSGMRRDWSFENLALLRNGKKKGR